jgi:VWFA-related protein
VSVARQRWLAVAAVVLAGVLAVAPRAQDATPRRGFSVTISEPENQAIVFGKTKIAASVQVDDPDLVDRVEFLVGDKVVFVDRERPYECYHDFGEESRTWIVRAVAHHKEAVTVSDAVITRKPAFAVIEQVDRVVLWLAATDKKGNLLTELARESFRVFEGDEEQEILEFYREDRPIALALLIDSSSSMQESLKEVRAAASSFVDTLREEDRALLIDFDDEVYLLEDLTSDRERLKAAIASVEAVGGTALFDVMHAAYRKIGGIEGRKAIILLSDGKDTSSHAGFDRVFEEAKSSNTIVFPIGLGDEGGDRRKDVLQELADVTGGQAFFVKRASELADVYARIAEELRAQHYLTYSTTNERWDGRWIDVRVETDLPDATLRARRGYFAVRHSML